MNTTSVLAESSRIEIPGDAARAVEVRAGATISVVRGKVWITQEGDARDHCVCAGVTFCADRDGRAVIGAVEGPAAAIVTMPEAAAARRMRPGTLRIDSVAHIAREARRVQAESVARAFVNVFAWLVSRLRRLTSSRHEAVTSPGPAPRDERFRGAISSIP